MLFLLYFGRKRSWKRDILGRAGYICRMRKKLLFLMAGAASVAGPVQAQFNTVSTVPFRYRVEVVSAGRDNAVTLPGYTLSVQDTLPPSGDAAPALSADTCKHVWIERYLSVSYPLVSLPGKGLLSGRGMSSALPVLQDAAPVNTCIFPASSTAKVSIR